MGESPGKDCKAEAPDGGCGGVPHNKCPPPPGQEKGDRGDEARPTRGTDIDSLEITALSADRGPKWRLGLSSSRASRREIHPNLNRCALSVMLPECRNRAGARNRGIQGQRVVAF